MQQWMPCHHITAQQQARAGFDGICIGRGFTHSLLQHYHMFEAQNTMWASGQALFESPNVAQTPGCLRLRIEHAYDIDEAIYFDTFTYDKKPADRRSGNENEALDLSIPRLYDAGFRREITTKYTAMPTPMASSPRAKHHAPRIPQSGPCFSLTYLSTVPAIPKPMLML
jgi:hypothetical protein